MDRLPEDIELMVGFLGREDLQITRLLKVYIRNPKMRETVRNLLKRRCVRAGFDPDDPPVFWPVRNLEPGILSVGWVVQGAIAGPHFALPEEVITQHLGIFGHNGTGKTYLAMHLARQTMEAGLRVWIFDIEDEYSRLSAAAMGDELIALEPEQLRINLFQPPGEWVSPASWLDELNLLLRGGTFLRNGSLMGPDGQRIIVEVCCSSLDYDANNILIETGIADIDLVLAITPDSKTRKALQRALEKNQEYSTDVAEQSIRLVDAGQCLAEEFDWFTVLVGKG